MEIKIFTSNNTIDFNYIELTNYIKSNLEKYNNLTFNANEVKEAKETRATLNKLRIALDTRRKDIKKEWNKPYLEFEDKIKTLINLIAEPINRIDKQIREQEDKYKINKRIEIVNYFNDKIEKESKLNNKVITLDKIWNNDWLNKSVKIKDIKNTIDEIITKIEKDIALINSLPITNYLEQIKDKYLNTLDLSLALQEQKRLEEQDKQLKLLFSNKSKEEREEKEEKENNNNNSKRAKVTFEVMDSLENIYKLRDFMRSSNINYRRI